MNGSISIHRMSTEDGHVCNIEIEDRDSRTKILSATLSFDALGNAITGLSSQDIEYTLGEHLERAGKTHYYKVEPVILYGRAGVFWNDTPENRRVLQDWLREYEKDGWRARFEDGFNSRKTTIANGHDLVIQMGFDRWV